MSEQIIAILKRKLDELTGYGELDAETRRNALKEELQFYVLNFIYHHPEYSKWIMYGGSALRIIHGLDRMSVDLDFEVPEKKPEKFEEFLDEVKTALEKHFANTYGAGADFLTVKITTGRGLLLKFHIDEDLGLNHPSKQVHVKIDLNYFAAPKTVTERQPISRDQLSFVITAYNMSALMASKIAAIFLRGTRGVGEAVYEEKGRDIYDLLWYMNKKAVPDLDYLKAKEVEEVKDLRTLFTKLTIKMNAVNVQNLKQDLTPLFLDQRYITNWLNNWHESYLRLCDSYKIRTVTNLEKVRVFQDFRTDVFSFIYEYRTEEGESVRIICNLSDYWIRFKDGDIPTPIDNFVNDHIEFSASGITNHPAPQKEQKRYASLFYEKIEAYFKKINRVMLGNTLTTKVIRMTADNLNRKEQIVLNKSALLSCELDDLLK